MNDIYPYYLPGAIPILLIVIVGIPILFYRLVQTSTKLVEQAPQPDDTDEKTGVWKYQIEQSQNICRNLYISFKHKFRHYQVTLFIQKMLVVGVAVFGIYAPGINLVIILFNVSIFYVASILYSL